jgi:DNA-binding MarR family transcriptional regulator
MPDLPLLYNELVRFETELWNALEAQLRAEVDLPLGWFEAMRIVEERPNCRVYDIADALAITVGGTSKLVDRIEAAGHCRRRPNPEDRRSSIVELTESGRALVAEARGVFDRELDRRIGSVVSAPELDQLLRTLTRLRAAGHQLDPTRKATP